MEKVEPSANRLGALFTEETDPEPSRSTCWRGSARRSKIVDAGAWINRETEIERDEDTTQA